MYSSFGRVISRFIGRISTSCKQIYSTEYIFTIIQQHTMTRKNDPPHPPHINISNFHNSPPPFNGVTPESICNPNYSRCVVALVYFGSCWARACVKRILYCRRFLVGQYVTIHDDVISHVNVSNLREEDGGEYTCTARNAVAQVSHSARINVYGLPFIRPMPRITAVAGSDLVVKCPVAGHPIESITWERGTV